MLGLEQAGRVDQIAAADRVENRRHIDLGLQQFGRIGLDFELRLLPALHHDGRDAERPIQPRLELVGCHFPEPGLRHRIRRQAVAQDRERRERQTIRRDLRRRRQLGLDARNRGVDTLQRLEHVDLPREEQIDFHSAAAGDRPHDLEALHGVDRLFDLARDRHLHLVDRRDAVVDADDDSGEVDFGKNRDRDRRRQIDAGGDEREDDEDDRLAVTRRPVLVAPATSVRALYTVDTVDGSAHQFLPSFSSASFSSFSPAGFSPGFMIRTLALSSRPTPPTVITFSPGSTPAVT